MSETAAQSRRAGLRLLRMAPWASLGVVALSVGLSAALPRSIGLVALIPAALVAVLVPESIGWRLLTRADQRMPESTSVAASELRGALKTFFTTVFLQPMPLVILVVPMLGLVAAPVLMIGFGFGVLCLLVSIRGRSRSVRDFVRAVGDATDTPGLSARLRIFRISFMIGCPSFVVFAIARDLHIDTPGLAGALSIGMVLIAALLAWLAWRFGSLLSRVLSAGCDAGSLRAGPMRPDGRDPVLEFDDA